MSKQLSAEWEQKIKQEAEKYMHIEVKGLVDFEDISPSNLKYAYEEGATTYAAQLIEAQERIANLEAALKKVAGWALPATGQFWDDDKTLPMSYGACYGSNGERDYMRHIANEALSPVNPKKQD